MANTTSLGLEFDAHYIRGVELHSQKGLWALGGGILLEYEPDESPSKVGARLKEKLKEANIKTATATVCVQGDAEFCKEVRYPDVPENDEPPIVHFQATKDAAVSPDDAVLDYQRLPYMGTGGERRALAFTTKRSRMNYAEKVCEAAGLKISAVVPRSIAVLSAARPAMAQMPGKNIVLVAGGELTFARDQQLLLCRHIGTNFTDSKDLVSEMRRSLAAFRAAFPGEDVHGIFYASDTTPEDLEAITSGLKTPLQYYAPLRDLSGNEAWAQTADYAIAAGAALATSHFRPLPVNYSDPKKVKTPPNRKRAWTIIGVVSAALAAGVLWLFYWLFVSDKQTEIAKLDTEIDEKKRAVAQMDDVEKKMTAITNWSTSNTVILDELYDLFAYFPEEDGLRITKIDFDPIANLFSSAPPASAPVTTPIPGGTAGSATPGKFVPNNTTPAKSAPKETTKKPVGKLLIEVQAKSDEQLTKLRASIKEMAKHWSEVKWDADLKEKNKIKAEYHIFASTPKDFYMVIADPKLAPVTGEGNTGRRPIRPRPAGTGGRP